MKKLILLSFILSSFLVGQSQSGNPDPSFGNGGVVKTYPLQQGPHTATFSPDAILEPNGNLIFVISVNGKTKLNRRFANGTVDASYGTNGYSIALSMIVTIAARQADGKIIVAGSTDGNSTFMLARYNTNGTLDASFGNSGVVIAALAPSIKYLIALTLTPNGKIVVGGFSVVNGSSQSLILQYNSSGTPDNGFGNNGVLQFGYTNHNESTVQSLAAQPDGKIVAAGAVYTNGNPDFAISRFNSNGTLDLGFNGTGQTTRDFSSNDVARAVIVGPAGEIYVGGNLTDGAGVAHFNIARYNSNGTPDNSYNGGLGYFTNTFGSGYEYLVRLKLQADGKLLAAGHTTSDPLGDDIALLRLNSNGTIDNNFGPNGNGQVRADNNSSNENAGSLLVQSDGKIIIGGSSFNFSSGYEVGFIGIGLNSNGTSDASFGNGGYFFQLLNSSYFQYTAVFQQANGKVLAVSETSDQNINKAELRRFNSNGSPDAGFGQNGVFLLNTFAGVSIFQPDGKLLRVGSNGTDIVLTRNNPDGTIDAQFGNGGEVVTDLGTIESALTAGFQPDGKIVVGGLTRDANGSDFLAVRYNANGTLDGSFGVNGFTTFDFSNEEAVNSVVVGNDGKIVLGGSSLSFFPIFRSYTVLARLNANGSIDLPFGVQGLSVIDRSTTENFGGLVVQNDNKIVFVTTENVTSSLLQYYIGRLNTDGSFDNNFGQGGITTTNGPNLILQADQKIIVAGSRRNSQNNNEYVFSRFTTAGQPDQTFGNGGEVVRNFAGLDNFIVSTHFAGTSLFTAGAGVDMQALNLGMIVKLKVGCAAPDITGLSATPNSLWPPNHKMKNVALSYSVSSECGLSNTEIKISSNEAPSPGESDWEIVNNNLIKLRAERNGSGNGRIYTIKVIVTDVNGNKDTAIATVTVPKTQGQREYQPISLTVSPNPSSDHFTVAVKSKSNEKITIRVLSYAGRVFKTLRNVNSNQTLRIGSELKPGTYVIEAKQGENVETKTVVKL